MAFAYMVLVLRLSSSTAAVCPIYGDVESELGRKLSPSSSIDNTTINAPHWSLYRAPKPAFVVNVASEIGVAMTVGPRIF